jgi:hypothetical protein
MADANPFGAPVPPQNPPAMEGNPFGWQPTDTAPPQAAGYGGDYGPSNNASPYAPAQQPPPGQAYAQQQPAYSQPAYGQQPYPQQQPAPTPMYAQGGYAASPYAQQGHAPAGNAVVVSQYQSNPYAGFVAPPGQSPPAYSGDASATSNPFDPFAAPPPAPAPAPVYSEPAYTHQQPVAAGYPAYSQPPSQSYDQSDPFGGGMPSQPPPAPAPEPVPQPTPPSPPPHVYHPPENNQSYGEPRSDSPQRRPAPSIDPPTGSPRNKYSQQLARQAPPGASQLPKAELVRKKGYVLGRISFRTIVIKKWKQAFWVQYGAHTMLWFRSETDFGDWLNNPYHNQSQRNFLIKLAVNFVHDLYKPNVRGYQVTQCRTKAYGNKMVRQFKLERWMDYGPTIAAAFGSYNPKEVDDLRDALVECMRNTPLSGGIRATGAVRQSSNQQGKLFGRSVQCCVSSVRIVFLTNLSGIHPQSKTTTRASSTENRNHLDRRRRSSSSCRT